jgi:hypothetical protein
VKKNRETTSGYAISSTTTKKIKKINKKIKKKRKEKKKKGHEF